MQRPLMYGGASSNGLALKISTDRTKLGERTVDVTIIGAGAAGLMCAIVAAKRGRRVLVLEGSNKVGKKILMSGGGRCNFTNLYCSPEDFLSSNPAFCISALSCYTPADFIALVERHGVKFHEKNDGQLFCDGSSKDILGMLLDECRRAEVEITTHCNVNTILHQINNFQIETSAGKVKCNSLVIASGGLSIPKMGASDFGYRVARQFGLRVCETRAGLVPYTLTGAMHEIASRLSGVSINVALTIEGETFADDILFTHRGLSGPAVLQSSNVWRPGLTVELDLAPDSDIVAVILDAKLRRSVILLRTVLSKQLPRALVLELEMLMWPDLAETPIAEISDETLNRLAAQLHAWQIKPSGTEGYRTAEVTLGGVATSELSSKSMECRNQPGLYFIGEVVDVTGRLGGFNFQWAWASGHAAGRFV